MARWFDETAKSAARRDAAGAQPEGMTRRTAITRGAVVAGVAWTAPLLMQTRAYAGVSTCTGFLCTGTPPNATICCATGDRCYTIGGVPSCVTAGTPGGTCGNSGNGNGGCTLAKCNGDTHQCNGCANPNVCGGEGAFCNSTLTSLPTGSLLDICGTGLTCTLAGSYNATDQHCRVKCAVGPVAIVPSPCFTGQVCDSTGFCAQLCDTSSLPGTAVHCQAGEICAQDTPTGPFICNYNQHA